MAVFILILLVVGIPIIEIVRPRRRIIDYLTLFHLVFYASYVIPAVLIAARPEFTDLGRPVLVAGVGSPLLALEMVLAYVAVLTSYLYGRAERVWTDRLGAGPFMPEGRVTPVWILLAIGLGGTALYVAQYGGLATAVMNASAIRAGAITGGHFVFAKRFIPAIYLATLLAWSTLQFGKRRRVLPLILALGLTASSLGFLLQSGRALIILLGLSGFWIYSLKARRIPWAWLIGGAVAGWTVVVLGDPLFNSLLHLSQGFGEACSAFNRSLDTISISDQLTTYIDEFKYNALSLAAANDAVTEAGYRLRLLVDVPLGILSYLPEQWLGLRIPETIAYLNTERIIGEYRSLIPPGFIALGVYSFGWSGAIIIGAIMGWCGRWIESLWPLDPIVDPMKAFLYVAWGTAWAYGWMPGEPRVFMQANFMLFAVTLVHLSHQALQRHSTPAGDA